MELTEEQIEFLGRFVEGTWVINSNGEVDVDGWVDVRNVNLTEIPVKFGNVSRYFSCFNTNLTTLKNAPKSIVGRFYCSNNNLTDYFKNIKEEDFPHWGKLNWNFVLQEYPFLITIGKNYIPDLKGYLNYYPQTKIYLE